MTDGQATWHHGLIARWWSEFNLPEDREVDHFDAAIELRTRLVEHDPMLSRLTNEVHARLWRDGAVVDEETHALRENLYFAPELMVLLELAGFRDIRMEAAYEGRPATPADDTAIVIARR